jgi:hypothetical protein
VELGGLNRGKGWEGRKGRARRKEGRMEEGDDLAAKQNSWIRHYLILLLWKDLALFL